MILDCPSCRSRYELPESLLGAAGARVRCPECGAEFAVDPGGRVSAAAAEPAVAAAPIAASLVAGFAARSGEAVRAAHARGRALAEWGPQLVELFDEYRRRAGAAAPVMPFREALRRELGIDLPDSRG